MICGGQGDIECILCKGNGRKMSGLLGDFDLGICDECHSTGVVACRYYRGTGREEKNY